MALVPMKEIQKIEQTQPPSKYDQERQEITRIDEAKKASEAAQQKADPYGTKLSTDYDRIKADVNEDGIVSKDEYVNYVQQESKAVLKQNIHENHTYVHFDYTLTIVIGIICLTAIIITFLKRKE